jgi:hypothetical protein
LVEGRFFFAIKTRVTRLGEFSPVGRFIPLGGLLKLTEVAHLFVLLFTTLMVTYVLIFTKCGLGFNLGEFFTNSSGHPD